MSQKAFDSFWVLPNLSDELRGFKRVLADAYRAPKLRDPAEFDRAALIVGGFGATPFPYRSLGHFLNTLGIGAYIANFAGPNARSRLVSARLMKKNIREVLKSFDHFCMIGHSLGGLEAALFAKISQVELIVALGSPFQYGTPWEPLRRAIGVFVVSYAKQEQSLRQLVRRASPYAHKIVTITTDTDCICPPSHGEFPMARNFVYRSSEDPTYLQDPNDRFYNTHGALMNFRFTRDVLKQLLT